MPRPPRRTFVAGSAELFMTSVPRNPVIWLWLVARSPRGHRLSTPERRRNSCVWAPAQQPFWVFRHSRDAVHLWPLPPLVGSNLLVPRHASSQAASVPLWPRRQPALQRGSASRVCHPSHLAPSGTVDGGPPRGGARVMVRVVRIGGGDCGVLAGVQRGVRHDPGRLEAGGLWHPGI